MKLDLKNKTEIEKFNYVLDQSQQIEESHNKQEQYLKIKHGNNVSVNQSQQLNNMLIDSIKAKVALLDEIK